MAVTFTIAPRRSIRHEIPRVNVNRFMRFGVSSKVFLAYAVLLTAFAATSAFSVAYLHSTRQHVVAHNHRLEVNSAVEACLQRLTAFDEAVDVKPAGSGTYLEQIRYSLEDARVEVVERFLAQGPTARDRLEFENYRRDLLALEGLTGATHADLMAIFKNRKGGERKAPGDAKPALEGKPAGSEPKPRLTKRLREAIEVLQYRLRAETGRFAGELSAKQERATSTAIGLGIAGLLGAIGAAVSLWRTIRPLQELRIRARQIASGDYARRIGLASHDEIGDLAREFDAMAQALEEREQRLIRSERLATVGKVAAQITHEIRNPLASIGLSAELLGDELKTDQAEANRLLGAITGEVDRLSEITESYLRFVRLPRPVIEREDPIAIVTSVMEFARAELAQAGISLELVAPAPVPEIAADENQLRQALLNLIRNAKEAMPEGGRLRVTVTAKQAAAAAEPPRVTVAVTDSGPGIPAEHAQRIFEPFFSTKASGTGLGLALVQQIVAEHGGQISIHSPALSAADDGPPGGTTFVLEFPGLPPARPEAPPADATTGAPGEAPGSLALAAATKR
jgi:signal transduction histidine kinase